MPPPAYWAHIICVPRLTCLVLHNGLLCSGTYSGTGAYNVLGGTNVRDLNFYMLKTEEVTGLQNLGQSRDTID